MSAPAHAVWLTRIRTLTAEDAGSPAAGFSLTRQSRSVFPRFGLFSLPPGVVTHLRMVEYLCSPFE